MSPTDKLEGKEGNGIVRCREQLRVPVEESAVHMVKHEFACRSMQSSHGYRGFDDISVMHPKVYVN